MKKSRINEFKVSPLKIMKSLSKMVEESKNDSDENFFYDRMYFMKNSYQYDEDTYQSEKPEDKLLVLEYGLESINQMINQVLRFGRIVYSDDEGEIYNFPKGKRPRFEINDIFSKQKHNTIKTNMNRRTTI